MKLKRRNPKIVSNRVSLIGLVAQCGLMLGCLPIIDQGSSSTDQPGMSSTNTPATTFVVNEEAPSQNSDATPTPSPIPDGSVSSDEIGSIKILNSSGKTRDSILNLELYFFEPSGMKVSLNGDCSGGTWGPYKPSSSINVPAESGNRLVKVSVQYLDWDQTESECYVDSILHDDKGPSIIISQYPMAPLSDGQRAELIYEVSDQGGVGTSEVTCSINGVSAPCADGRNSVTTGILAMGQYTFEVTAKDNLGNVSTQKVEWSVTPLHKLVQSNFKVNDYNKVDILFVIDNSGSMAYEQKSMADRVRNFMKIIDGLDWQIAVTTTDARDTQSGGDGKLLPLTGLSNQYILKNNLPIDQAQNILGKTLQRSETGSGSEQGIRATYRAVERSQSSSNPQHVSFMREGAHFATIVISDEDESDNTTKNDPAKLLQLIQGAYNSQKNFSFHSIITIPGDKACRESYGAAYGDRYQQLSKTTGGVVGSVCASDYAGQVEAIADSVRNMVKTLTLPCEPVVGTPISITRNGQAHNGGYKSEGRKLLFDSALPAGDFQVAYSCLK